MKKVLIVYSTSEGQTRKIAHYIAQLIADQHFEADLLDASTPWDDSLSDYDGAILGGSIHLGRHGADLTRFVEQHVDDLGQLPTAFYSVSLSAAGVRSQRDDAKRVMNDFFARVDWEPDWSECIAGAVKYRKYNWLKRLLMKTVVYFAGGDTDTSHDHEYTDWEQIDSFTLRFKQRVRFAEQPSRIASPPQSC
ncbi:MAG: menaquinone-dependent protoporphyrinogen IX dehydrogenase [Planctomycetales bacterium]|nr:menaquinone-dependent protoporphyrinogen IX dehydrogenase [Planctomycetales bacterium]